MDSSFDKMVADSLGAKAPQAETDKKWKDKDINGEKWDFKVDKELVGVYVDVSEIKTKFGMSNIYRVEKPNGEIISVWQTAQIKRFFESIKTGQEIRIVFQGQGRTKDGQPCNLFKFQVRE